VCHHRLLNDYPAFSASGILGCVTAACVAERFPVIACDPDSKTVQDLRNGQPPIFEPGLKELNRFADRRRTPYR